MEGHVRLAFLGCGSVTGLHSRTLRAFRKDVACLYASRDGSRALAYNRRFAGAGAFDSYEAAIGSERVDTVLIALPPALHLDWTLRALHAGKHVIVEKPPFLHAADFQLVEQAARDAGRRVLVAENYFYKPLARRLRDIVRSGVLGQVLHVDVDARKHQPVRGWRARAELAGGGALFEGGIHWVDLMANLGVTVHWVRARRLDAGTGPERGMVVHFEYQGGAGGVLTHSWDAHSVLGPLRLSRIFGSRGTVTFESNGLFVLLRGPRPGFWLPDWKDGGGYAAMFGDFLRALSTGREPDFTLERARRDLEWVEAAYRSTPIPSDRP
ncbi:MAG: Gfo/Idh/MocA family oxidoreductase [Gemmatimonadetes bacterium]|nr:Gfo/Idh/MocA family oxidoreductase [Gemmatimonadota bacterium]